ncbi:phage baseplate assembly protein [Paraburkholderia hospita]|uniref:phage baseplate assembly protein n=1 Tax=Paraburkholderia hospita TaxID=169430 RepID=UPI003ECF9A62
MEPHSNVILEIGRPVGTPLSPTSNVVHYTEGPGAAFAGWTNVRVTAGVERMPRDFEIEATELLADPTKALIQPGDYCTVKIGDQPVVSGYVDTVAPSINANGHSIRVTGRGKCGDLVDCSAQWPNGQISNANALAIATQLADVYGIKVALGPDVASLPIVPQQNVMLGETAYEIIERVCRFSALMLYELADGSLFLARAGTDAMSSGIQEGINMESASVENSMAQRYSEIVAVMSAVNNLWDLNAVNAPVAVVTDPNVPRHRQRIVIAEAGQLGWNIGVQRAQWEVARRSGHSKVVRVTVDNWHDVDGNLWEPNKLIDVLVPSLKIAGDEAGTVPIRFLISEVTFHLGLEGTHAELTLMAPEAYLPEPILLQPNLGDINFANVGAQQ